MSEPMTLTDALATALDSLGVPRISRGPRLYAEDILAALPEGTAFVTVQSLAAALDVVTGKYEAASGANATLAAAIIQATKEEAERE